jgi:hypothetical protein
LDYIFTLNFWDSNTLTLLLILCWFYKPNPNLATIFIFNFFIKFNFEQFSQVKRVLTDTLYIGTITVHPLMFYTSLVIFIIILLGTKHFYTCNAVPLRYNSLLFFLIITLLLGGFWGFQSTIWGYFWVNDTVEWVLLLIIFYLLYTMHTTWNWSNNLFNCIIFFILLNLVIIIRLNLLPTRHSFIQNPNIFLLMFYTYLVLIFAVNQVNSVMSVSFTQLFSNLLVITQLNLLVCKVVMLQYLVFFVTKSNNKFLYFKLYTHVIFFTFFLIWNIYFGYFYISYSDSVNLLLDLRLILNELVIDNKEYIFFNDFFKALEGVMFVILDDASRSFSIVWGLNCLVYLNNFVIVFLVIFFL